MQFSRYAVECEMRCLSVFVSPPSTAVTSHILGLVLKLELLAKMEIVPTL